MKQLTGSQIRALFLEYFKSKGHMIEPGASLVPHDDPTLLWINAGVAALKKYFDGSVKPESPRIANAQKSIRTNDIENVGKTVTSSYNSLKCWEIFLLVITSKKKQFLSHGSF